MPRPRYFVFDVRSPVRMRHYQDLIKLFLIAVGCLSVGLHIALFSRSTFDTACSNGPVGGGPSWRGDGPRLAWSSSESRKSSSDQGGERLVAKRPTAGRSRRRPLPGKQQQ